MAVQSANVAHVLVILTRLRQLCDHPSLFMTDRDLDDALSHPAAFLQGEHPPTAESATSSDPTRDEVRCVRVGRTHADRAA